MSHRLLILKSRFKKAILLFTDILLTAITMPLALFLRLDPPQAIPFLNVLWPEIFLVTLLSYTLAFVIFKPYRAILRLANLFTALSISAAILVGGFISYVLCVHILPFPAFPRSTFIIQILLLAPLSILVRFAFRIYDRIFKTSMGINTIIYGAGLTTDRIIPLLSRGRSTINLVGIVDDDLSKRGAQIQGVRILGTGDHLSEFIRKYDIEQVVLSMPEISGIKTRAIATKLMDLGVQVKVIPNPDTILTNPLNSKIDLRDLNIEDLLRRPPRQIDRENIYRMLLNKVVLVTGGGGSIGSELVRQIVSMKPRKLIVADSSEFGLYRITEEIRQKIANEDIEIVASLCNFSSKIEVDQLFTMHKINLVFHACAYKHVPMIEENIIAGIRNNVVSAWNVFDASQKAKVTQVVLISTDKAVHPTNVMGASKRVCELLCKWFSYRNGGCETSFVAVRFGNVLASSGSVIPKFLEQINHGGPITVTHPEMTRYFMLIPEAVSLVLQAATNLSKQGDVFVLNMGEPIKIVDLAKDLIRLSGKRVGEDIEIKFVGLRPGEKLYEELSLEDEEFEKVSPDFARITSKVGIRDDFEDRIRDLIRSLSFGDASQVKTLIFDLINQYQPLEIQSKQDMIQENEKKNDKVNAIEPPRLISALSL